MVDMYSHSLLGRHSQKFFCKMPIGQSFYINIFQNYEVGTLMHEDRISADFVSDIMRSDEEPINTMYRIKVTKTKKCKKNLNV